jgi:hypothetical protein
VTRPLVESLNAVAASFARLEQKAAALLRPGLPKADVEARLGARGLAVVPELVAGFGWRDGTEIESGAVLGDLWFVPGLYLLSLEDALANYDE